MPHLPDVARPPAGPRPGAASALPTRNRRCTVSGPADSAIGAGSSTRGDRAHRAASRHASRSGRRAKSSAAGRDQRIGQRERLVSGQRAVLAQDGGRARGASSSTPSAWPARRAVAFDAGHDDQRQREDASRRAPPSDRAALARHEQPPQVAIDGSRRRRRRKRRPAARRCPATATRQRFLRSAGRARGLLSRARPGSRRRAHAGAPPPAGAAAASGNSARIVVGIMRCAASRDALGARHFRMRDRRHPGRQPTMQNGPCPSAPGTNHAR